MSYIKKLFCSRQGCVLFAGLYITVLFFGKFLCFFFFNSMWFMLALLRGGVLSFGCFCIFFFLYEMGSWKKTKNFMKTLFFLFTSPGLGRAFLTSV